MAQTGNTYYAIFTNSQGSVTTSAATLTVQSAPVVTTQPTSQTVAAGTANVTFTAAATGSPTPTVQWLVSTNGGASFTPISGATSATYTIASATEGLTGNEYEATFTNTSGSVTTNPATLTVTGTPIAQWIYTAGLAPTAQSTAQGTGNAPYATYGPLTNTSGTLGLQNDYTGVQAYPEADILLVRSTVNPSFSEYDWRVRSGSGLGPTGSPGSPEGWSQTAPQYAQGVQFNVNTTGYSNVTLHFDWNQGGISDMQPRYSTNGGSTWTNLPNGLIEANGSDFYGITSTTAPTGITVNLQGIAGVNNNPNFQFQLVAAYNSTLPQITDGNGADPTVHGQFATGIAGSVNAQQVVQFDSGVSGGTFTLAYTPAGGSTATTAPISYSSDPTTLAANITSALGALTGLTGNFTVSQTNYSGTTLLQPVRDALGQQNDDMTITFNGALAATAVPTLVANSSSLSGGAVTVATWVNGSTTGFKPYVDGGGGWSLANFSFNGDSSNSGGLAVSTNPSATSVAGGGVATFTATAYSETLPTVTWQVSTDGGNTWNTATGTTSPTTFTASSSNSYTSTFSYTSHTNLSDNGYLFRAVFSNSGASVATSSATLTVVTPVAPTITQQPTNTSVQAGNPALFTATASGAPTPTVQWQISTNGGSSWTNLTNNNNATGAVSGATSNTLSLTSLADASQNGNVLRAAFTNPLGTVYSNVVTLTVLANETVLTKWDFTNHSASYDNSPPPTGGVVDMGTATAVGMTLPYNPNDPATGTDGNGSVNADDIVNSPGALNPNFNENTWRIRGGINATTGGTPANGWSNLVGQYTQGAAFSVPTTGYGSIYATMDWYATTSGELDAQRQYTLDGTNWINIGNPIQAVSNDFYGATATGGPVPIMFDLSAVSGAANDPNFGVRLVNAYDPYLSNTQSLNLGDTSNFTLGFNGQTTGTIAYSANATTLATNIQNALRALSNVGAGNVTVTSTSGSIFKITFGGTLNVVAQPAIVPTDSADTVATNYQYANALLVGSPPEPAPYNGSKGNWRFANIQVHGVSSSTPPAVVSVTANDGEADGVTTQGSEVRQLVVTFNEAVTLTQPGAFSVGVLNLNGTNGLVSGNGANDGSTTDISSVLNSATSADGGTTWVITFATGTANTDASGSLIDGLYSVTINDADVSAGGVVLTGSNTFNFHRLYGDLGGIGTVNNGDARPSPRHTGPRREARATTPRSTTPVAAHSGRPSATETLASSHSGTAKPSRFRLATSTKQASTTILILFHERPAFWRGQLELWLILKIQRV